MIDDEKALKTMFGEYGSLHSFGAKVRFGYLLGVFGQEVYKNLLTINDIRNRFAHRAEAEEYKWNEIRDRINNLDILRYFELKIGTSISDVFVKSFKAVGAEVKISDDPSDYKNRFISSVFTLIIILENISRTVSIPSPEM